MHEYGDDKEHLWIGIGCYQNTNHKCSLLVSCKNTKKVEWDIIKTYVLLLNCGCWMYLWLLTGF